MPLSFPISRLQRARDEGRAVAALSVYNLEQVLAVCRAAESDGGEVIMQAGSSAFRYAGMRTLAAVGLAAARASSANIGVHLDHSTNADEIAECLDLGYTSVMYDGSQLSVEENMRATAAIVEKAHARGAWVEAELVGIAGDEDESRPNAAARGLTDPVIARRFVEQTGVDALAVAIGNVHGLPATPVRLDLRRLAEISEQVPVPLVLHGASGLEADDIRAAIRLGVAKINVNTELRQALAAALAAGSYRRDDLESLLGPARDAVQAVASEKIRSYRSGL